MYVGLVMMLKDGKYAKFKEMLERYMENALSYFDVGGKEPERVNKAFLLGILSIALNGYEVESEIESGYGRLDVVVYPKEKRYGRYGAIFEVKRGSENDLEILSEEALKQIREREYYRKLAAKGYRVIGFGVAFSGKRVVVKAETAENQKGWRVDEEKGDGDSPASR